jgi:hypothetical protein
MHNKLIVGDRPVLALPVVNAAEIDHLTRCILNSSADGPLTKVR